MTVLMIDGSLFDGSVHVRRYLFRNNLFYATEYTTMSQLVLARALTSADDTTSGSVTITATTADGQFTATQVITYTIAPPIPAEGPPVFSGWPASVGPIADNSPAGTVIASGTLTDSDGTPFNGTVAVSSPLFNFVQ